MLCQVVRICLATPVMGHGEPCVLHHVLHGCFSTPVPRYAVPHPARLLDNTIELWVLLCCMLCHAVQRAVPHPAHLLEHQGLQAALQEVLWGQGQHVIELVLGLVQQAVPGRVQQQQQWHHNKYSSLELLSTGRLGKIEIHALICNAAHLPLTSHPQCARLFDAFGTSMPIEPKDTLSHLQLLRQTTSLALSLCVGTAT